MSQSNKQDWFEYASDYVLPGDLIEYIYELSIDNKTKSQLLEFLIRDKFNEEFGINLIHSSDCEYADLVDENMNIYIRVDADCKDYEKWVEKTDSCFETNMVCIYIGFIGLIGGSIHEERSYELRNDSNLIVIDPGVLNNHIMDLIRLKIYRWCDKKVKLSKFYEKASSE